MCRCNNCNWPVYTHKPLTINCPQCGETIKCLGGSKPAETNLVAEKPRTWPAWAKIISKLATAQDKGVGDTVARIIDTGYLPIALLAGKDIKEQLKDLGMPCGCAQRQEEWNARYKYYYEA